MNESIFSKLNSINVNDKTEKKNGLTYLSWAWAWGEVKKLYPDATYTIYENTLPSGYVVNYFTDGRTSYVKTGVTINNLEHIEIVNCDLKSVEFYKLNEKIKSISFIKCENLDLKYPEVEDIIVIGTKIDFKNINFRNVKKVFIQNCVIKNAYNLNNYLNIEEVNLDGSELYNENDELIQDVLVSKNTKYTHEKVIYYYDS